MVSRGQDNPPEQALYLPVCTCLFPLCNLRVNRRSKIRKVWGASGKIKIKIKKASSAVRGERGEAMELRPWLSRSGHCRGFPSGHRVLWGFCRFSGLLHALEVRDLLMPAGKWKHRRRSRSVLMHSPPEGRPAVPREELGLLCSAGSGLFWGSSCICKNLIEIIHPFLT